MPAQPKQQLELNELETLRQQLAALYDDARNNERILKKFQRLELKLLNCSSLPELIEIITHDSRSAFGWDTLTIILRDEDKKIYRLLKDCGQHPECQNTLKLSADISHLKQIYGMARKPVLGLFEAARHSSLFAAERPYPGSVALLPLQRNNHLLGSLNLGSDKAQRFQTGHATDFLQHLAAVLATCLHTSIVHEKLKQTGLTDALTGINNRRFFDQRLQEEISRNKRFQSSLSCLFIDIDNFKTINDSFGHDMGDFVLKKAAALISAQIRSIDVVARYGGEEFAVLLGQSSQKKAIEIAQRICAVIAETAFQSAHIKVNITVSIGVSTFNLKTLADKKTSLIGRHLMQHADKALYQAKQNGRNQVVFLDKPA